MESIVVDINFIIYWGKLKAETFVLVLTDEIEG